MPDNGLLILTLDSPAQPTYAQPDFGSVGRWATLTKDGSTAGTFWTDGRAGFGFLATGAAPKITAEIRLYVQTSASAGVRAVVAYGTALRIFPAQFDLAVQKFDGRLGQLFEPHRDESARDGWRR